MVTNSLTKKENTFSDFITSPAIKKRIGEVIAGKEGLSFITAITSAVTANQNLGKCNHLSIFSAGLTGAALKLSPSPQLGQFYIVPYGDKAEFQIGYKGYIQLAIRSGQYKKINVMAVKDGELKRWDPMNEEITVELIEDDEVREKAETIGYYAVFEYLNGFVKAIYWSKKKMIEHAKKYSKAYASDIAKNNKWSFWSKDFDGMAFKTMLRHLISKWGIISVDTVMQKAVEADDKGAAKTEGAEEPIDITAENTDAAAEVFDKAPKK